MNWTELTWTDLQQVGPISVKFHYTDTDRTRPGRTRPDKVRGLAGDTGHSPTKSALARLVQFRVLDAFIDHARQRHDLTERSSVPYPMMSLGGVLISLP